MKKNICKGCEREHDIEETDKYLVRKKRDSGICSDKCYNQVYRKPSVSKSNFSDGLGCRVRSEGETMRSGDIVLISDTFRPLGFHTDFYHYFAGLEIVEGMTGKVICKAT